MNRLIDNRPDLARWWYRALIENGGTPSPSRRRVARAERACWELPAVDRETLDPALASLGDCELVLVSRLLDTPSISLWRAGVEMIASLRRRDRRGRRAWRLVCADPQATHEALVRLAGDYELLSRARRRWRLWRRWRSRARRKRR